MLKKLFTSCLISLSCLQAADSQISKYSATINAYSSDTRSDVKKIEPSSDYSISIGKAIDQKTFAKICSDLKWITQLNTSYGNKNLESFAPLAKLTKLRYFEAINWTKSAETPISLDAFESLTDLEELKLSLYRIGLCTSKPDATNPASDWASKCVFIMNKVIPLELTLSKTSKNSIDSSIDCLRGDTR